MASTSPGEYHAVDMPTISPPSVAMTERDAQTASEKLRAMTDSPLPGLTRQVSGAFRTYSSYEVRMGDD
jgi:hypothetical protein